MDDTDRRLLALLRLNARASFTSLAKELGTSEATVRARMKRLVDSGTIRRFTIRTAGNNVKALIEVRITSHADTGRIAGDVSAWDGVEAVWEVTGDNDLVVVADCPDANRLNSLIDRIRAVEGTESTRSRLVLREA